MRPRDKLHGCLRKRPLTRRDAEIAVAEIGERTGRALYLYRCENPDNRRHHWHVTHVQQRRLRTA